MPRAPHRASVAIALLLAGCGAQQAALARHEIVGMPWVEAEACLGPPNHTDKSSDGSTIAEWDYAEPNSASTIPLGSLALLPFAAPAAIAAGGNFNFSLAGSCRAIARIVDGRVATLRYAGDSDGAFGRDGICVPIVRGCLRRETDDNVR